MTDREKVIKGLEQCVGYEDADNEYSCIYDGDTNPNCPYAGTGGNGVSCMTKMMRDALALLKAQEPRVLTLAEYKALAEKPKEERDPVWEEWPGLKNTWAIPNQAYGGYGTSWRCWTSRPTDEQREATSWNE